MQLNVVLICHSNWDLSMGTHTYQTRALLKYLRKGILHHSIEKDKKIINMLNSFIDDKKDGKMPFMDR